MPSKTAEVNRRPYTEGTVEDACWQIVDAHYDEVLAVKDLESKGMSSIRVLDVASGIWRDDQSVVVVWLAEGRDLLIEKAAQADVNGHPISVQKTKVNLNKWVNSKGFLEEVNSRFYAFVEKFEAEGKLPTGMVMRCKYASLDADTRYLGCKNGVVDLHAATLLPAVAGKTKLVTKCTKVEFNPKGVSVLYGGKKGPFTDNILQWHSKEVREYIKDSLAFSLLGNPSQRFNVWTGPGRSGKSTLMKLVRRSLGDYASYMVDDLFRTRSQSGSGLTPEYEAIVSPVRLSFCSEVPDGKIGARLIKRMTGDDAITWRGLHQPLRLSRVTGSMIVMCNPESEPSFGINTDPAMHYRLSRVVWPKPQAEDPTLDGATKKRSAIESCLAEMVIRCAAIVAASSGDVEPPEMPAAVKHSRTKAADRDRDEFDDFASCIVADANAKLPNAVMMDEWKAQGNAPVSQQRLTKALGDRIPGFTDSISVWKAMGKATRGVKGWRFDVTGGNAGDDDDDSNPFYSND